MKFATCLPAALVSAALLALPAPVLAQNALQAPGSKPIGGSAAAKQETVP